MSSFNEDHLQSKYPDYDACLRLVELYRRRYPTVSEITDPKVERCLFVTRNFWTTVHRLPAPKTGVEDYRQRHADFERIVRPVDDGSDYVYKFPW